MAVILLLTYLCQSFSSNMLAQQIGINPVMKVSNLNKGTENPMRLDILNIDIKIIGQTAVTTMDMTYYNDNSRLMEGEFNFPLADGQSVSRFALDINGVLREGAVVEKEKGRKTFEAVVRRGVDPGLLEMTAGNNFRMRVYPLPAKGKRRVVLSFEQELTDKGTYDLYTLPLKIDESIGKFSVHAEVIKNSVNLDAENNELNNLSFNKWNDSYVADFVQSDYVPDKKIAFSFPHINNEEKVFTSAKNGSPDSSYFYVNLRPKLIKEAKVLPKCMTLLWDNSNSSQNRNIEKEIAVLDNYIQKIGNLNIDLVCFNIKTGKAQPFEVTNGNWERLKSVLKSTVNDGGTTMGCLDFTQFKSDEILLFSDGMTTFGSSEPKFSNVPVYTLNSNVTADPSFLMYISQHSGGIYIDLNKLTNEEVLTKLTTNDYHFISAVVGSGQVSDVYPSIPSQFNNTFSLTGIMAGKSASLVLNFGVGSTITYSKQVTIDVDNSADQDFLRHLWAEKKIAELSLDLEKHQDEITLTGKKFGIVTPNTSLIVLENLNDYLSNDIVPPLEMQKEYFNKKYIIEKVATDKTQKNIESVLALSAEQSNWWGKTFVVVPPSPVKKLPGRVHTPPALRSSVRFTAPVVREDNEMKSQEELTSNRASISLSDVKGNDIQGIDIADIGYGINHGVVRNQSSIELNAWDPQTPYLKVLQYATVGEEYATYIKLKKEYGTTPSFYIDASDFFSKSGKKDTAVTILSNLAELKFESPQLLRVLANKLQDFNRHAEAIQVFDKVLKLKREEPQSYRDLGLAYESNGDFQRAIQTMYEVVKKEWDHRFPGIGLIVMNEINSIIATHPGLDYKFIDKRLIKNEPVNVRVCLTWDTDNCYMDLWVTDPYGEKCFYENKLTKMGGKISDDFTGGYGPEEFMIKKAVNGKYSVQANYYGTHEQSLLAPVNLHLVFITNFGKPNQKRKEVTIRLDNQKDVIEVGKFRFTEN